MKSKFTNGFAKVKLFEFKKMNLYIVLYIFETLFIYE